MMVDEVVYDWNQRHTRKQKPAATIQPAAPINGHGYGNAALNSELDQLLATAEGKRNDQLNLSAFNLAQLTASGHLPLTETQDQLRAAAAQIGLPTSEVEATLRSAFNAGQQQPREVKPLPPPFTEVTALQIAPRAAEQAVSDEEDEQARTSWWPEPIAHKATQAADEPEPTHLLRDDGQALFYSGKVNGLIGESESGKSWVALLAIVQAVNADQQVLILDFEDSAGAVHRRLQSLGCSTDQLERLVHYASPDESLGLAQSGDLQEALGNRYSVIVVDGVNAAMTLLRYDLNSNTDATLFNQKLLKPLAATGACVITVDHVPKSVDQRGKGGIGAQAKRAMMDGCCLAVEVVEPFGKGQSGTLKLLVDKDRPGRVRGVSSGAVLAGRAHLDSIGEEVRLHVTAPDLRPVADRGPWRPTGLMEKISRLIERTPGMGSNDIVTAVDSRKANVLTALGVLIEEGFVTVSQGTNRQHLHSSAKPYRQVSDPDSEKFAATKPPVVPGGSQVVPGTTQVGGSRPVPPIGDGNHPTTPNGPPVVPVEKQTAIDLPDGYSNCNRCGAPTADHVIDQTAGYCQPCGRVMNP